MKQLSNDYTTLEQSKELISLGLPKHTADCAYNPNTQEISVVKEQTEDFWASNQELTPIWSKGRLLKISCVCNPGARIPSMSEAELDNYFSIIIEELHNAPEQTRTKLFGVLYG